MGKKRRDREEQRGSGVSSSHKSLENGTSSDRVPPEEIPPGKFLEMFASMNKVLKGIQRGMQVNERMKEKYEENSRKIEDLEKRERKYQKMFRKIKKREMKYKMNITMIKEELEALKQNVIIHSSGDSSPAQRAQLDQRQQPRFKLRIVSLVRDTIYKGKGIQTNTRDYVEVHLLDGAIAISPDHPLSSAKVKLVVLDGEFNKYNDQEHWLKEDFEKFIKGPREGNSTLRIGKQTIESIVDNCTFNLIAGIGCHPGAIILDNSNRKKVRLGAMVLGRPEERVLEGISNHFKVQEAKTERQELAVGGQPSCTLAREHSEGHVGTINGQQRSPLRVSMHNLSHPTVTQSAEYSEGFTSRQNQDFPVSPIQPSSQSTPTKMMESNGHFYTQDGQHHVSSEERQMLLPATMRNLAQTWKVASNDQQGFQRNSVDSSHGTTITTQNGHDEAMQIIDDFGHPPSNSTALWDSDATHILAAFQLASFPEWNHEYAGDVHAQTLQSGNGGSITLNRVQLLWDEPDMEPRQRWDIVDKLMPLYTTQWSSYGGSFPDKPVVPKYDWLLASDHFFKMRKIHGIIMGLSSLRRSMPTHHKRGVLIQSIAPNDSEDELPFKRKRHVNYELRFVNKVCRDYYTGEQIKAEDGDFLKVALYNDDNIRITSGPLSSALVEIVLLHGDFSFDGQGYYTSEEFNNCILYPESEAEQPALAGDLFLSMADGEANLDNVTFQKISTFARTGKFKMGVKLKIAFEERVKEGITQPFLVRSHKGEGWNHKCLPPICDSEDGLTSSSEVCALPVPEKDSFCIKQEEDDHLLERTVVPLHTWVLISNFKVAYNMLRRPDGSFDRNLADYLDRCTPPNARPVEGVSSFDHVIDQYGGLQVRIFRAVNQNGAAASQPILEEFLAGAPSPDPFPVIIFFHGGSFAHFSSSSAIYDHLCRRLVKLSTGVIVSVNYRRAPEHRYPCAYDDGWTALQWALAQPCLRSGDDAQLRVFLYGDSSGGNIAHHVAVRAADEGIKISGNILLSAMFGGNERTESERRLDGKYFVKIEDRDWYWKAYLPEDADRDHPACNPFGPNGRRLKGLPFTKSLIVVSGLDLTCDRQLAYAESLQEDGLEFRLLYREKATIGFYLLSQTDHYYEVMDEISNFLHVNL